jgi:putative ABC transport system permease protein
LRRNKRYYYKSNHFIAVSGMMYRMKQNAAGLATICILATMVLVMVSSTASLYFGMEDVLNNQHFREIAIYYYEEDGTSPKDIETAVDTALMRYDLKPEDRMAYRMLRLYCRQEEDQFITDGSYYSTDMAMVDLWFIPLEDYLSFTDAELTLQEDEVLLLSNRQQFDRPALSILGHTFTVQEPVNSVQPYSHRDYTSNTIYTLIVKDLSVVESIQRAYLDTVDEPNAIRSVAGFNLDGDDETLMNAYDAIMQQLSASDIAFSYAESRAYNRAGLLELYGGLFFLGLFLSVVFLLATVLIIYYKQISEGYDDQRRYAIMQQVGLSRREARRSINAQILTMFFLPLIVACVHIAFAFPALTKMLFMLSLQNVTVFLLATIISVVVFSLFYMAVYFLTARVYYRIVNAESS